MRIVPDINTTVSGLLWPGPSAYLLRAASGEAAQLFSTEELVLKLSEVIRRTKFTRRMEKVRRTPEEVVAAFRATTQLVEAAVIVPPAALRDPDDAAVLACAVAAHADFIVSGDKDLLSLGAFEGIPIISAVDAARTLGYRARARASVI